MYSWNARMVQHSKIKVIHHTNRFKFLMQKKHLKKIQYLFIKTLNQEQNELPQHNKLYIKNPQPTYTQWQTTESCLLRSGKSQRCPLLPFSSTQHLEVLARTIKQVKEIKGIQIGKEEVKLPLFTDNMIMYIDTLKNPQKN